MVVADPTMTADKAPELAKFLATRLKIDYFTTLERLRDEDSQFQYIARQVPASLARSVVDAAEEKGFEGLDTRPDPVRVYPARDVAANLVGFLGTPRKTAPPSRWPASRTAFDSFLSGTDGEAKYQVGGGNRIPLGDSTDHRCRRRQGPADHHRPRPAVVRPAGARADRAASTAPSRASR